ncbi:hypothetical protein NE686_17475 [Tissierella carlieri]|uniref:Large polyvalent protein associated domain-containing protein n=1 Tax=Tissierella carlieri TaxID=689904 RepID=A0ABT1SEI5_9FIRM|nr:hypothetical protein [Tissierella carlieri]MCQ4924896.1 hypothetical protein [Tissierella carlieri]
MEFNFTKKGLNFKFRNPKLDKYDMLVLEHKIEGIKESKNNDGYYANAEFSKSKKAITFVGVKIGEEEINGVYLPDDIYDKLVKIEDEFREKRNALINNITDNIIDGKILIDFKIVGCDYPHYQPWIRNIPEELKGQEQKIIEKAIKAYHERLGKTIWISNSCDYLERKLKKSIFRRQELMETMVGPRFNKETQEYYDYKEDVVTGFEMKLSSLINAEEIKAQVEKERKKEEEINKIRNSLTIEIIDKGKERGSDGSDYYVKVKLTDPLTGECLKFNCRNIFDFGYVVNPDYMIAKGIDGGIVNNGKWETFESGKGWIPVRDLTEFERKCIDYLNKFPPVSTGIRL